MQRTAGSPRSVATYKFFAAAAVAGVVLKSEFAKDVVPLQLAVCTAVGIIVGLLVWTVTFR